VEGTLREEKMGLHSVGAAERFPVAPLRGVREGSKGLVGSQIGSKESSSLSFSIFQPNFTTFERFACQIA
jgi:hypothetical protein